MHRPLRLPAALVLGCIAATAFADGDPAAGKIRFETCRGCHSVPGYANAFPNYHVPKIAGQHASRIVAALQGYKSGERSHTTMHAQAASLSDQDIQDVAAYLAALGAPVAAASTATPPEKVEKVCKACHGPDGNAPAQDFPVLAGQHHDYLLQALKQYRDGQRSNVLMAPNVKGMSDAELRELAAWFAAQAGPLQAVP